MNDPFTPEEREFLEQRHRRRIELLRVEGDTIERTNKIIFIGAAILFVLAMLVGAMA